VNKVIILPIDGAKDGQEVLTKLRIIFASPLMANLVAYVKFNDGLQIPGVGPEILAMSREVVPDGVEFFIDLKTGDVSDTVKNILRRYAPYRPGIVTISSIAAAKTFAVVREILPDTKIALVDTLTDIKEEECVKRFGMKPVDKIAKAIGDILDLAGPEAFDMFVCSPKEVNWLRTNFGNKQAIVPGIRSPHMAKDHQERVTSAYDALKLGAKFIVMGAQVTKGNPDAGISAEESQLLTYAEIKKYSDEQAA